MITTDEIGNWLREQGLPDDAGITTDGEIPPMPDRLVVLTRAGGGGPIKERTLDAVTLQVITRDGQRSSSASEEFAEQVDAIFTGAQPPIRVAGKHVVQIDGGPPAFLDRDESQRVSYVANYLLWVARDVQ